jgi:hypothetical protein
MMSPYEWSVVCRWFDVATYWSEKQVGTYEISFTTGTRAILGSV